jgi:hypothetical protein
MYIRPLPLGPLWFVWKLRQALVAGEACPEPPPPVTGEMVDFRRVAVWPSRGVTENVLKNHGVGWISKSPVPAVFSDC